MMLDEDRRVVINIQRLPLNYSKSTVGFDIIALYKTQADTAFATSLQTFTLRGIYISYYYALIMS